MAETILLIYYYSRFIDIIRKVSSYSKKKILVKNFFCYISKWAKNSKKLQSSLIIFAQRYLCKCKNTYIILQNKYLCIYEDSFGAKILRDALTLASPLRQNGVCFQFLKYCNFLKPTVWFCADSSWSLSLNSEIEFRLLSLFSLVGWLC